MHFAGPLSFRDLKGTVHDLDALLVRNHPVVLVFWQTWCASCLREAPAVAAAAHELQGRLSFFGIVSGPDAAVDDRKVERVVAEKGLSYPQIRDRDLRLTEALHVDGTPTIVVLGRGRRILYSSHHLPSSWQDFAPGKQVARERVSFSGAGQSGSGE
jgi:thiol-disulfide isomerase/thioredoxin